MKIVLISPAPPFRGGIATHSACLYHELSKKNSVLLINYNRLYPSFLFPGKSQFNLSKSIIDVQSNRIIDSINPLSWKLTADKINDFEPDIVLFRYWNPFFAICLSTISKYLSENIKKVALCDNIIPHERYLFDEKLIKYFFDKMDGFIVQSSIVEKELISINNDYKYTKLFHPIYNYLNPEIDKQIAKNILGIKSKYVALFFGLVRDYKGFDVFIESAKIMDAKNLDISFLAVGECYSNKKKYKKLLSKYNLNNQLKWIDEYIQDEEINKYFSASDFIILPYKTASQSGIISLAYHFNKPVITTKLDGLLDYMEPNKTGYVCEIDNPNSIVEAIELILKDDTVNDMSSFISKYKEKFSWTEFCNGIENFRSLL